MTDLRGGRILALGTQREQLSQRMKRLWPRPCLLRPLFRRFLVYKG